MPTGLSGPYRARRVSPATIVGSANGRSISELTTFLPGNSSRTSTHAISVPKNALTITTISDAISVSLSAATASGLVTAFQKPSVPFSKDLKTTAASGISATTLRYAMATPRPRAAPGIGRALGPRLTGAAGGGAASEVASVGGSALPLGLEDLRHDALLGVEEVRVDLVPASELGDLEQAGRRRELVGPLRALHDRAVALADEDLLGLSGVEEVHEALRELGVTGLGRGRDRVLDQQRLVRDDVVELLALLLREDRLVLVAEEHVSLAARERLERLAGALVQHRHVLEQLGQVLLGLGGRLALLELSAVRGHDAPLRAAGGERVRLEHLDVAGHEVVPVLDVLRVALTDHEHTDGLGDHALVLVLVPVRIDEVGLHEPGHVGLERELDDIRRQAALDGTRLLARRGIGLGEAHSLALFRLVEGRNQLLVRLLGSRVGDQGQLAAAAVATALGRRRLAAAARHHQNEQGCGEPGYCPLFQSTLHAGAK